QLVNRRAYSIPDSYPLNLDLCILPITPTARVLPFVRMPRPPRSTLFPYTTLFRSYGAAVPALPVRDTIKRRAPGGGIAGCAALEDRKSTRLNSSHVEISYAVFCLKKKKKLHGDRKEEKNEGR